MNGHELTEMPVNGTPISENLSRATGINFDTAGCHGYYQYQACYGLLYWR